MIKTIKGFPKYKIDELGNVYSVRFNRPLKTANSTGGYQIVTLMRADGTHTSKRVHRLVLETFVGKCPQDMQTCHNNGNNRDNRLSNLRWDTMLNNHLDKCKHGTSPVGSKNGHAKLTEQDVRMVIHMWDTGLFNQCEIAKYCGVHHSCIHKIVTKKSWKHIWKGIVCQ